MHLEELPEPPATIRGLYESGRSFLDNLRSYNNALAMASIGCEESVITGFNPTFKIHGKVYHRIGALLPNASEQPKFAQIYFHNTDHEVANRLTHNSHLSADVVHTLQQTLHQVNPYIQSIMAAIDYTATHPEVRLVLSADKRPTGEHVQLANLELIKWLSPCWVSRSTV